jgi:hypothetical protein
VQNWPDPLLAPISSEQRGGMLTVEAIGRIRRIVFALSGRPLRKMPSARSDAGSCLLGAGILVSGSGHVGTRLKIDSPPQSTSTAITVCLCCIRRLKNPPRAAVEQFWTGAAVVVDVNDRSYEGRRTNRPAAAAGDFFPRPASPVSSDKGAAVRPKSP